LSSKKKKKSIPESYTTHPRSAHLLARNNRLSKGTSKRKVHRETLGMPGRQISRTNTVVPCFPLFFTVHISLLPPPPPPPTPLIRVLDVPKGGGFKAVSIVVVKK
jgi:hypothetical protein